MRPEVGRYAEELYLALAPVAHEDERHDWSLLHLAQALGVPHDEIDELSLDGIGWSAVLDLDRCPDLWLPWLAQFWGVRLTAAAGVGQWRDEIRDAAGMRRGTPASIIAAAKIPLTGNKTVTLRERDGGAYRLGIITYDAETPDPPAVMRSVLTIDGGRGVKPAGLVATHTVLPGWVIDEMEDFYVGQTISGGPEAEWPDLDDFEARVP